MKYIVFGGNGFVGQYLVEELLKDNYDVIVAYLSSQKDKINNSHLHYMKVDIRQKDSINQIPFEIDDIVINLAATQYHSKVPKNRKKYFYETNVEGNENILSVMRKSGCNKYIMFSNDMVYGKPEYIPVDTSHEQKPFGPYGESKRDAEIICNEYRLMGMQITIFRPRMIMGPGRLGVLMKLFKLMDLNLPLPVIGNGKNHYQMISVFDCVSAIRAAIDKGIPQHEYNIGSELSPNVYELLNSLIKSAQKKSFVLRTPASVIKFILRYMDNAGLTLLYPEQFMIADEEYVLDISKTKSDLNWVPKFNDQDMLNDAYHYYKNNLL